MFRLTLAAIAVFSLLGLLKPTPELAETPVSQVSLPSQHHFVNLNMVRKIICFDPQSKSNLVNSGTGGIYARGRMITAAHVLNRACFDAESNARLIPLQIDHEHDIAVLGFDDGSRPGIAYMPYRCRPVERGAAYSAFGYANGINFVMSHMVGTGVRTDLGTEIEDKPAEDLDVLVGDIVPGMSGGPLIDADGYIVGINSATDNAGLGFIRSLRESPLCRRA